MEPIYKVSALSKDEGIAIQKDLSVPSSSGGVRKQAHEWQEKASEIHEAIRENLGIANFKLNFSIDSETKTVIVRILDADTGKVIQEIPPAEILAIAKEIEKLKGILFNENV